jgi:hypothetical protein
MTYNTVCLLSTARRRWDNLNHAACHIVLGDGACSRLHLAHIPRETQGAALKAPTAASYAGRDKSGLLDFSPNYQF